MTNTPRKIAATSIIGAQRELVHRANRARRRDPATGPRTAPSRPPGPAFEAWGYRASRGPSDPVANTTPTMPSSHSRVDGAFEPERSDAPAPDRGEPLATGLPRWRAKAILSNTTNSASSTPLTSAHAGARRSVHENGTPRRNPRNSGGSPSGVSKPPRVRDDEDEEHDDVGGACAVLVGAQQRPDQQRRGPGRSDHAREQRADAQERGVDQRASPPARRAGRSRPRSRRARRAAP